MRTAGALNAIRENRMRITIRFDALDADIGRTVGWHHRDLAGAFDFLGAVVEARFDRIRAGVAMTREVIG